MKEKLMKKKLVFALAIVFMAELLYVGIDGLGWKMVDWQKEASRYSIGLPLRSIRYTVEKVNGVIPPWENYPEKDEWNPGLQINPFGLAVDTAVFVLSIILLMYIPSLKALKKSFYAICIGLVLASAGFIFVEITSDIQNDFWIFIPGMVVLWFVLFPVMILWVSRGIVNAVYWKIAGITILATVTLGLFSNILETVFHGAASISEWEDIYYASILWMMVLVECLGFVFLRRLRGRFRQNSPKTGIED